MKSAILKTELTENQLALWYLGQEAFLVKFRGKYLLFDPYLSDSVDRRHAAEENDSGLWHRNFAPPITPAELDFVDFVFCSHGHMDHADPDTLSVLAEINKKAKYVVPAPIVQKVVCFGVPAAAVIPARDSEILSLGGISVQPIAAAHEVLHTDARGDFEEMGYKLTLGAHTLYHAGDCCLYDGLKEKIGTADVALLPVNGRDYYRLSQNVIGNMNALEAVTLAQEIHASLLIPMHFDLYTVNGISAASFVDAQERHGTRQAYHIFQPGEKYIFG